MKNPLRPLKQKEQTARHTVWFDQANFDIEAAKVSKEGDFHEWACYQAQQAVEKSLKALILHSGWHPPRTHKLAVLIGLSNNVNQQFRNLKFVFRDLEVFTYISRYPFLIPGEDKAPHKYIHLEDAEKCIDQALNIMTQINELLGRPCEIKYEDVEKFDEIDIESRLNSVKDKIVQEFNPEKIVLFGGYAKGEESLSTLDILVVAQTDLDFVKRIERVREITKGGLPVVEPLIYTPDELNAIVEGEGDSFIENALDEGKVIYEKQ